MIKYGVLKKDLAIIKKANKNSIIKDDEETDEIIAKKKKLEKVETKDIKK